MTQGEQEFGCSFYQTEKTQGIYLKPLKISFYTGNLPQAQENLEVLEIKGYTSVAVCCYNLLTLASNLKLGDIPVME